jgi:hypothetical protein
MLIAASILLFILLLWVESRAADPILPLPSLSVRACFRHFHRTWRADRLGNVWQHLVHPALRAGRARDERHTGGDHHHAHAAGLGGSQHHRHTPAADKVGYRKLAIVGTASLVGRARS